MLEAIFKLLLILGVIALVIAVPLGVAYAIYLILVKLGAAKWIAAAVAIIALVLMGISKK